MNQHDRTPSPTPEEATAAEKATPAVLRSKQTSPVNQQQEPGSNLLHQITADFLTYESRTRTFLKSLLPTSTPRSGDLASDASSGAVSNESQNLRGFEGLLAESDGGHYRGGGSSDDDYDDDSLYSDDEPDGEDCSSNSSGVYNTEYRDRRLRQILAGGSSAGGSDRESTDGTPSVHRSRNNSVEPQRRESSGNRPRTRSSGSRNDPQMNSGPLCHEQVPWDLREQLIKLDARLRSEKDRFSALDQSRRCAVLRVAKGSLERAYSLSEKYSQLIDRFALQMISHTDVDKILSRNCFMYLAADPKLCKDGRSAVLWIAASRLPPMPEKDDKKTFQRQELCMDLLRALLFLLETNRFGGAAAKRRGRGRSVNSNNASDPASPLSVPLTESHQQQQGGEAPQRQPAAARKAGGTFQEPPPVVVLVDVSHADTPRLSSLAQVLSVAADLFRDSYPMKIRAVVINATDSTQFAQPEERGAPAATFQDPSGASTLPLEKKPLPETGAASERDRRGEPTKKPFSFVTSLFKKNNNNNTAGTSNNTTVTSRMWLSVTVSTWKLRFLSPTLRARTSIADFKTVVDPVRLARLLLTSTQVQQNTDMSPR